MRCSLKFICVFAIGGVLSFGCGGDAGVPPEAQLPSDLEKQRPHESTDEWADWETLSCDIVRYRGPIMFLFARASSSELRRCGWFITHDEQLAEFENECEDVEVEPGLVLCRGYNYDTEHGTGNMAGHAWLFEKRETP